MIYVDALRDWGWELGPSCHMCADTEAELHAFAKAIGLKKAWFQDGKYPHYDLTVSRRKSAVCRGAIEVSPREFITKCRVARTSHGQSPMDPERRTTGPGAI